MQAANISNDFNSALIGTPLKFTGSEYWNELTTMGIRIYPGTQIAVLLLNVIWSVRVNWNFHHWLLNHKLFLKWCSQISIVSLSQHLDERLLGNSWTWCYKYFEHSVTKLSQKLKWCDWLNMITWLEIRNHISYISAKHKYVAGKFFHKVGLWCCWHGFEYRCCLEARGKWKIPWNSIAEGCKARVSISVSVYPRSTTSAIGDQTYKKEWAFGGAIAEWYKALLLR